jgi:hypothetical protein
VITGRARELKALGGEFRTLAQLEADVACDLIAGIEQGARRVVEVEWTSLSVSATWCHLNRSGSRSTTF